jgi:hypothetical protein
MHGSLTIGALVCAAAFAVPAQSPTAPKKGGNPDAAKIKNPVEARAASLSAGKRAYQRLCGKCHGPEGAGDGTSATATVAPSDLTSGKWVYGGRDGEMFSVIHDGVSTDIHGRLRGPDERRRDLEHRELCEEPRTKILTPNACRESFVSFVFARRKLTGAA